MADIYNTEKESIEKHDGKNRYIVIAESVTAHCCFEYSIIDTSQGKEDFGDYWKGRVCEAFEKTLAILICDSLNKNISIIN